MRIADYKAVVGELKRVNELTKQYKKYFTTIRRQTSIDDDGVAEEHSLLTYRLIKSGISFEVEIDDLSVDFKYKDVFDKAILNLRYLGIRRNRGFGKVEITISEPQKAKTTSSESVKTLFDAEPTEANKLYKLVYQVVTNSPVLIAKPLGDQNTVETEQFIPNGVLRGVIANNVRTDRKKLEELVLSGNVKITNAFQFRNGKCFKPIPLALGYDKGIAKDDRKVINQLNQTDFKNVKTLKGWYDQRIIVCWWQPAGFHNSRRNRLAGRSNKDNGDIFYYESLDEGQTFQGDISGTFEQLKVIDSIFLYNNGRHRIGRSKAAQYAEVVIESVSLEPLNLTEMIEKDREFYIVFESPVIIYNDFGTAVMDIDLLKKELASHSLELADEKKLSMVSSVTSIEGYLGIWKSKTPRENAYAIGTTLRVKATEEISKAELEFNGLGERTEEGFGRIRIPEELGDRFAIVNETETTGESNESGELHTIVKDILEDYKEEQFKNKLKFEALKRASKAKGLNNHQVYRLREQLRVCNSQEDWKEFMAHIKDLKIGKQLANSGLLDDVLVLETPSIEGLTIDFKSKKDYWDFVFKAIRVNNNNNTQNHE